MTIPAHLLSLHSNETVNQQIYRALRRSIINCYLLPGEAISDKEISDQFGVSRQPVRDAFIKLASNGLIQIRPQRGTFVMKISIKRVNNGRFIRDAIETAIVRRAAAEINEKQLTILENLLKQQEIAAKNNDLPLFLSLDEEFHASIASSIDCKEAWELIEDIKAHMDRVRFLSLDNITPLSALICQHQEVLKGIANKNPDQSEIAIRHHLNEISLSFEPIRERNPDWFEDE